ncbi:hypothetical protein MNBD_NITROSPINAE01-1387 [hydrothermal vent metagenome]|uniref:Cytochrome c domain-containing protein n=1 Tax=hydrothermal vent metagenome TaxID=652676 RepID=A0A3B1D633_9ZZZZ
MKSGIITLFLTIALIAPAAFAADGKAVVESNKCGDCHKMAGPAVKTIAEIRARKAPDLFYAGSKFKKDWLVGFLQKPEVLRPAGTVYANHISDKGGKDVIGNVPGCASKLSAGDAAAAADYLMTLKDASMKEGIAKLGKFKKAKAKILVLKKQGCNACHQIKKKGKGGVSCPTLYNAGFRLNPDWIYSFVQNPQHWDPKVWMAGRPDLSDSDLQLIVNYLSSLKKK